MPRHRFAALVLSLVALAPALGGCGGSAIPVISFDPASPCTTDGRQPGAYPELEALLPTAYRDQAPVNVDSGRNCTTAALGTLAADGISGVRFAGATWNLGSTTGLTVAVFEATGLDANEMLEFYRAGAAANSKTDKLVTAELTVAGRPGHRLDVLQSDGTAQTVVTWPGTEPGRVHVLLAADLGDANVLAALDELAR
jgi:hypothetical protein